MLFAETRAGAAEGTVTIQATKRSSSPLGNALLIAVSVVLSIAAAEAAVRILNGQPLFAFPLPEALDSGAAKPGMLEQIPVADGVDRQWFLSDPPPLPNRAKPPAGWQQLFNYHLEHPSGDSEFRPTDNFKVWNNVFVGDPCKHRFLSHSPGKLFVYDPPDGNRSPPYRFYPDVTLPDGLVTNQVGWRGRPIEAPLRAKTVRIVFVGASTTVDPHHLPFSYPEFVGHWLNQWAASKHLDVRFEALNAGRESVDSTDIAAIVHNEVLPLHPDLVVYYEGGNQFRPASIVERMPDQSKAPPPRTQATTSPEWLRAAARYSALMGRVLSAVGLASSDLNAGEWPKPDYKVVWPAGLDEQDPELSYPNLPVSLNLIQRDLDRIRADLATVGGEFAISSFVWMVKDGMVLDPNRHRYILEQLNVTNYPFRYRDLERLAKFQNRLLAKYAAVHGLPFVDIARYIPFDPDLFVDAVHPSYAGIRLQAWIALQQLLPTIEKHLKDGTWPQPTKPDRPLPTFTPRQITFSCSKAP
jgi:hypothetical protein